MGSTALFTSHHRIIIARVMAMPSFRPPARPAMNIQWLVVREIHRVSGIQEERNQKDNATLGHQKSEINPFSSRRHRLDLHDRPGALFI